VFFSELRQARFNVSLKELSEGVEEVDATVGRGAMSILSAALVNGLHQC